MKITADQVKELREKSGAGVIDCRNILIETGGDMEKAFQKLKEQSLFKAEKKKERTASQGIIETYIHAGGRVGAMIELNCETDFAARTEEFKKLAHHLAMQIAAMAPICIAPDGIPEGCDKEAEVACLLLQPDIREPGLTIQDTINQAIAKIGENIKVSRFARFELGQY
ncbi:MAG: elongation factor Ts [Chloroflexota bacterium]